MGNQIRKRDLAPELTDSQLKLIKENVNKSDEEIKEWYQEFYNLANGKHLGKSDFIKYYGELLPYRGDSELFCELVFKNLDQDESKSLDFVEIFIGFTILASGDIDQRLEWMFNMYDQNGDGLIDLKELKTAIRAILIMTDSNFENDSSKIDRIVKTLLKNMDKDNDQKITKEDFIRTTKNNDIVNNLLCPRKIDSFFTPSH